MNIAADRIFAAIEATWPPLRKIDTGPWQLREGAGGGKRVSAASAWRPADRGDIAKAEAAMRAMGQTPLFTIRPGDEALDSLLAARGYALADPTKALVAPVSSLTDVPIPPVTAFDIWEPLAIMEEIWAQGGIGPARLAVMHRAAVKTAIFVRAKDRPAGTAFAALHDDIAMVHAVEVLPAFRRQGLAGWIMRKAAYWAREQGAGTLAVLCTRANVPAQALYSALGFTTCCGYHYRTLQE